jgi:transcriptional regulator with XRE-family HTH domain
MSTIAEMLGKLIDGKGFTPYQVARDTGVSDATLSRLLSGKTQKMSGNTARIFAEYFRVSFEWLMTGIGKATATSSWVVNCRAAYGQSDCTSRRSSSSSTVTMAS